MIIVNSYLQNQLISYRYKVINWKIDTVYKNNDINLFVKPIQKSLKICVY